MDSIKDAFVKSPEILEIINTIDSKIGDIHRRCPEHMLVIGPSGSGKTTLIKHLVAKYPKTVKVGDHDVRDIVPVLSVSLTKDTTSLTIICDFLEALGDVDFKEYETVTALNKLCQLINDSGVLVILIDEFHNIERGHSGCISTQAEKFFKDLSNGVDALVIPFGTPEALDIIEQSDELSTRFDEDRYMPEYTVFGKDRKVFKSFLRELSQCVDVNNPEILYEAEMPERIFYATNALPRRMANLIYKSQKCAEKKGKKRLALKDFYDASLKLRSTRKNADIFKISDEKVKELFSKGVVKNREQNENLERVKEFFKRKSTFEDALFK